MLTDPIADFLTRVRNASSAGKQDFTVRHSRIIKAIADVLVQKRYIVSAEEEMSGTAKEIRITLRNDREPLELKRVSKPGQRIYVAHDQVKRVRNGFGIGIISTSQGVISDEQARKQKIGGEYICEIY